MVRLGIDYGTSHTVAVANWPDGRVRPLLFGGSPLLESAAYAEAGSLVVGRDATQSARLHPGQFEPNPKRRIDDGEVLLGDRTVDVRELIAATLRHVLAEFTRTVGALPAEVTLTYPATWGATRRRVLLDAAGAAGLPEPVLVPEPVAAATYFVRSLRHDVPAGSAIVVYDIGAGTFDASVVASTGTGFEVLAVDGLDDFGGLDLDEIVLGMIGAACPEAGWQRLIRPSTVAEHRAALTLRDEAREARERLSRAPAVTVVVPLLQLDVPLTRAEFEERARQPVERTVRVTRDLLAGVRLAPGRFAGVFLVGGASRTPLVATLLHRELGAAPVVIEQPELAVAEGAALPLVPAEVPPPIENAQPVPPTATAQQVPLPLPRASAPMAAPPMLYPPPMAYPAPVVLMPPPMLFVPPRAPWTVRWPARVLTLSGALFLLIAFLAFLASIAKPGSVFVAANRTIGLIVAASFLVVAVVFLFASIRLRRRAGGHLWLPLTLSVAGEAGALVLASEAGFFWVAAALFLLAAGPLCLPSARAWVRRR